MTPIDHLPTSKRTVLIGLVVGTVLLGAGFGLLSTDPPEDGDSQPTTTETPTVPEPTVTPPTAPGTPTPGSPTESPRDTARTTSTTDGPTTTSGDSTATPSNATASPTATRTERPALDPILALQVADPGDVTSPDGQVESVRSRLSGTLSWGRPVDAVVLVIQSRTRGGWSEVDRVVVRPGGRSLDLGAAVGDALLATGSRARQFDNPDDATTVDRSGRVAVTAVFFADGRELGRTTGADPFTFAVTNEGGLDVSLDGDGVARRFAVSDVAPGRSGSRTYRLASNWSDGGTVAVRLDNVAGSENGVAEPERAVDGDDESELLERFGVRLAVVGDDDRRYLAGGPDRFVRLEEVDGTDLESFALPADGSRQVVLEWRLPASVGNEVMTDDLRFDLDFRLTDERS